MNNIIASVILMANYMTFNTYNDSIQQSFLFRSTNPKPCKSEKKRKPKWNKNN